MLVSQVEAGCTGSGGSNHNHTPRQKNSHSATNWQPSHQIPYANPKGPPFIKPGITKGSGGYKSVALSPRKA